MMIHKIYVLTNILCYRKKQTAPEEKRENRSVQGSEGTRQTKPTGRQTSIHQVVKLRIPDDDSYTIGRYRNTDPTTHSTEYSEQANIDGVALSKVTQTLSRPGQATLDDIPFVPPPTSDKRKEHIEQVKLNRKPAVVPVEQPKPVPVEHVVTHKPAPVQHTHVIQENRHKPIPVQQPHVPTKENQHRVAPPPVHRPTQVHSGDHDFKPIELQPEEIMLLHKLYLAIISKSATASQLQHAHESIIKTPPLRHPTQHREPVVHTQHAQHRPPPQPKPVPAPTPVVHQPQIVHEFHKIQSPAPERPMEHIHHNVGFREELIVHHRQPVQHPLPGPIEQTTERFSTTSLRLRLKDIEDDSEDAASQIADQIYKDRNARISHYRTLAAIKEFEGPASILNEHQASGESPASPKDKKSPEDKTPPAKDRKERRASRGSVTFNKDNLEQELSYRSRARRAADDEVERTVSVERQKLALRTNRGYKRHQMRKHNTEFEYDGIEPVVIVKPKPNPAQLRNRGKVVFRKEEHLDELEHYMHPRKFYDYVHHESVSKLIQYVLLRQ